MNPIFEALEQGHSPEEVIAYLSKMMPQMVPAIKKATKSGYSIQQILGFLSKNFDQEDRTGMSESERHAANRRADAERTKFGLKVAAGAVVAPYAAQLTRNAIARALPASLQNMLGGSPNPSEPQPPGAPQPLGLESPSNSDVSPGGLSPSGFPLLQSQGPNPVSTVSSQPPIVQPNNIPQAPQIAQPQGISNPKEILEKLGVKDKVDAMLKAKNTPEAIAATLNIGTKGRKATGEIDPEMVATIAEYAKQMPEETKVSTTVPTEEIENVPIKKADTVITPTGVGQVKEIRNGKALVEVDGKKHQVNADELIQSPLPEKDIADLYDDLIAGIEKQTGKQVSRNVEWAGYDPKTNELAYKPHGSDKLYAYDEISPEDVQMLTSFLTQRKSTGENFIGAWEKGTESPIGAAMYKLLTKLQQERGGKGNEYKNRYETIYDALEPAKRAAKEKHARLKKKKAKKPRPD